MCYAKTLSKNKDFIKQDLHKEFAIPLEFQPYYHVNGFAHPNLQIIKMDEPDTIYPAEWGLVPNYGMSDILKFRKSYNTLNAKSETLFKSNTYKHLAQSQRCLILADGFFEPHHNNDISTPYFCYIPHKANNDGRALFMFAGLYTQIDKTADYYTTTIITTEANEFFAEVHNKKKRMPLVLDEQLYGEWFGTNHTEKTLSDLMKHGFTSQTFNAHPVSNDIYKRGINNNTSKVLVEVPKTTLF
ncbi:SOS response-associated peptidase family protein [uncultured Dokdonia sp.]|uniref:SOS response-associated peptidase n=1 Tax=uncultured Dokdonia sp. TaxID=575653 RepID=UPI0026087D07|nr:SOS response-associated peptidase family protein [uncultured Dokdonia sp.]